MTYTHHKYKFKLASGARVMWNRIQGYSIEVVGTGLRAPTDVEELELSLIHI